MNRRRDLWRVLTAVVVTFAATEWLHLRLGDPTIFSLSRPATTQVITDPADDYQLVTPSEFHTYLQVLEAMQADHAKTLDRAAEAEHLNVPAFREIERRVHRDDVLVERTREALRKNAETLWESRRAAAPHP